MKEKSGKAKREHERKWLLHWGANVSGLMSTLNDMGTSDIRQGYILSRPKVELRIRSKNGSCSVAIKGSTGLSRPEWDQPCPKEVFDLLAPEIRGVMLKKRRTGLWGRFKPRKGPYCYELDRYQGLLAGLVIVEVEFKTAAAAKKFRLPESFDALADVTDLDCFKNKNLAIDPLPALRAVMEHYRVRPGSGATVMSISKCMGAVKHALQS